MRTAQRAGVMGTLGISLMGVAFIAITLDPELYSRGRSQEGVSADVATARMNGQNLIRKTEDTSAMSAGERCGPTYVDHDVPGGVISIYTTGGCVFPAKENFPVGSVFKCKKCNCMFRIKEEHGPRGESGRTWEAL